MGLTPVRVPVFFLVSWIGMLPGTLVYVNAGTEIGKLESLKDVVQPEILISFALIGALPLLSKWVIHRVRLGRAQSRFRKPETFDYNMVVIGGGAAGLVSAYIASAVRAKVALVEKHRMGGDCLNTGCVPSKALISAAKRFHALRRAGEFGFEVPPAKLDFPRVMARVQEVIRAIEPHDSVERYRRLGVECVSGEAKILSPWEVRVGDRTLTAKNIVVATGASPLVPPIPGITRYLTSDNIWNLRELPPRLVILGGGSIGCELAQCFARFGSRVTLVEMGPRIMAKEDRDVSDLIEARFREEGVDVLTGHKALRVDGGALICEHDGKEVSVPFDEILLALGRAANVKGFGMEELGVEISPSGAVRADEFLRTTNYPNIYVCGDVAGPYQFTHTASHQAWYASVNALFSPVKKFRVDYRVIPWCTFTDPEVARVGLSELEAKERNIPAEVTRYPLDDLDRAIADGTSYGFVKVLTRPGSDEILGVTIVGSHAGDIIAEYVAAMKHGFGLNKILSTIHIYPTYSEANKFAAGAWKRAHTPETVLRLLERYHRWRRG